MSDSPRRRERGACIPVPDAPGVFFSFPAICFQKQHEGLEGLNAELAALVLEDEKRTPGWSRGVSIRGGHHSDTRFLDREDPCIARLKSILVQDLAEYTRVYWQYESAIELEHVRAQDEFQIRLWGWAVVLREGDLSELHLHPQANLSGVYYVTNPPTDGGDAGRGGSLALCDPRPGAVMGGVLGQVSTLKIPPSPGGVVMFPSWMQHYVLPFRGPGERISIAFNVRFVGAAAEFSGEPAPA